MAIEQQVNVIPTHRITVSIGVAEMHPDDTQDTLFKKADDALYKAKAGGRNQVMSS
ncbi:MAG: diguanylate cyclase [Thiotrichales bacterium]|nr:diguanylate cyclase [Thiotrichales bacterium]